MNYIRRELLSTKEVEKMDFFIDGLMTAILRCSTLREQDVLNFRKNIEKIYEKEALGPVNPAVTVHTKIYYKILMRFKVKSI